MESTSPPPTIATLCLVEGGCLLCLRCVACGRLWVVGVDGFIRRSIRSPDLK